MMIGPRIESLMKAAGLSQTELARRVGVSQGTIAHLVSGRSRGSTHLHRIAAELRTTPAFLTGETDDPDPGYEPTISLSSEDRELLELLQLMAAKDRSAVLQIVRSLAGRDGVRATLHSPGLAFEGEN